MASFILILVRHGETEENRRKIIQGQLDVELSAHGLRQAQLLGKYLEKEHFTRIYCSDLKRAKQTCEAICDANKCDPPPTVFDERLRERSFGNLEGLPFEEVKKTVNLSEGAPANGETLDQVQERAVSFFEELMDMFNRNEGMLPSMNSPDSLNKWYHEEMLPSVNSPDRWYRTSSGSLDVFNITESPADDGSTTSRPKSQDFGSFEKPDSISLSSTKRSSGSSTSGYSSVTHESVQLGQSSTILEDKAELSRQTPTPPPPGPISLSVPSPTTPASCIKTPPTPPTTLPDITPISIACLPAEDSPGLLHEECPSLSSPACSNVSTSSSSSSLNGRNGSYLDQSPYYPSVRSNTDPIQVPQLSCDNPVYSNNPYICPNVCLSPKRHGLHRNQSSISSGRANSNDEIDTIHLQDTPSQVLVVTHGGWIQRLMLHFKKVFGCFPGDTHATRVSPNTGLSKFQVYCVGTDTPTTIFCLALHNIDHLNSPFADNFETENIASSSSM